MESFSFAILSDLHIGTKARAKDLCPPGVDGPSILDEYRPKFLEFLDERHIRADYLILPGDVTNTADPEEVRLASDVVSEVAEKLSVPRDRIVFVPGNHDVDWSVLQHGENPVRSRQRYDPIRFEDYIFNAVISNGTGSILDTPYLSVWTFHHLVVIGYNSSWHDRPKELLHHGMIDHAHLDALRGILQSLDGTDDRLRVFLVHHHPVAYDQPVQAMPDFSQMVNVEELLTLLGRYYFDLIIHGHIHQPRFRTHELDGASPLGILSAGSFSCVLPTEWQGRVGNQFHLVDVECRDPNTRCAQGIVKSWTYYCGTGWISSTRERDGIHHREPFGVYLGPHDLRARLSTLLPGLLEKKGWADWADLTAADPALVYVRSERVLQALEELEGSIGFHRHHTTPERLILLKEGEHNV